MKTAFDLCDQNKSGQLDSEDLARVAEEILPFVPSEEQLTFFRYAVCTSYVSSRVICDTKIDVTGSCRLMLDATGTSEFALHDVQTVVRECRDLSLIHISEPTRPY